LKFHHPGSGRKKAVPFAKGRQAKKKDLEALRDLLSVSEYHKADLIQYLHAIQDYYGYLSGESLTALSELIGLALAEVYEVATFYAHFNVLIEEQTIKKKETVVRVCSGLPCSMAKSKELFNSLIELYQDKNHVLEVPCVGRCALSPVAEVGHNFIDRATEKDVTAALQNNQVFPVIPNYKNLSNYLLSGGYKALSNCRQGLINRTETENKIMKSGLRGMGGAGFPAAQKWSAVRATTGPRFMVVNADEGEPGTFKDRHFLETDPHKIIEGALIAAWAVEAETIYIYLRDEYPAAHEILSREISSLERNKIIRNNQIIVRRGAGAYICGEESAMIESIEGKRGLPRHRPPYVAQVGLFGKPTLVHNVETLYWLKEIFDKGEDWYIKKGTNGRQGLRAFSVSGRVKNPGVKIAPVGITAQQLIDEYAGGMTDGHAFKAYLPGGASGGILPSTLADIPLDFGTLNEFGCFIGSAAFIVLSDKDSLRETAVNLMQFFSEESCGQCTPCRLGTEKALVLLQEDSWNSELLNELSRAMRDASICGLGQAAPNPIESVLKFFPEEVTIP